MYNIYVKNISPQNGLLLSLFLLVIGFVTFLFFGLITSAAVSGNWDLMSHLSPIAGTVEGLTTIRIMQMFQTTGMFIFPAVVMAFLVSQTPSRFLGLNGFSRNDLLISIAIMIFLVPGINLIASLNAQIPMPSWMHDMEKSTETLIKSLLITDNLKIFALNLFLVAVLPAIGEELFFRSLLQKYFIKITKSNNAGILITSLIFSAIHFQFLGFVPRFLLGMFFGYLYLWTGSIKIPIVVHFVNNGLAVFLYYLVGRGLVPMDIESIGNTTQNWQIGIASIVISGLLIWILYSGSTKNRDQHAQASEDL
jgi:membrane protease YdiL (CAAX protease family)